MASTTHTADVVIIGGGIWGLSTAWHLACEQSRKSIVVLERNSQLANETTRQAAGQIGQLRSDPLMAEAVRYTLGLYSGFAEHTGHDPHIVLSGSLHLAHCNERMAAFTAQLGDAKSLGIEVEIADSDLISKIAPTINQSDIVGALHVSGDGYVNAHRCALAVGAAAVDLGVTLQLDTPVTELIVRDGRVRAVVTPRATIETSCVVITAGPWTGRVASMVGIDLPMIPVRLQQARTMADPNQASNHPVVRIPDKSCYLRPEAGGYLFGFFDPDPLAIDLEEQQADFSTANIEPPKVLVETSRQSLAPTFPILNELGIDQYRQGMVTCTPDAGYVVGPAPGIEGIWVATGCGAMGIAGGGAVGLWLSQWILNGDPGADLSALALDRFGARVADRDWVRDASRAVCSRYYALESVTYSVGGPS